MGRGLIRRLAATGQREYALGVIARATPRLSIARFFIEGFRTFRERTEIPLFNKDGVTDEIAVFHGMNGSGKSNALAALDTFFRGSAVWLNSVANPANNPQQLAETALPRLRLPWNLRDEATGFELSHRNWPAAHREAQRVQVVFAEDAMEPLSLSLTPAGNEVYFDFNRYHRSAEGLLLDATRLDTSASQAFTKLSTALLTPHGPGSSAFFRLSARRAHKRTIGGALYEAEATDIPMTLPIAEKLYSLATSIEAEDTERWRSFVAIIGRFKTLSQRELSIVQIPSNPAKVGLHVDLRFEIRGKQVLRLSELSSGEQQIVALCAALLTSRAAIVAIEEPEISLHPDYQDLLREVLADQLKNGIVDQVILESHSFKFDGPEVVQFTRTDDEPPTTSVKRKPSLEGDPMVRERALAAGARRHWVSREGFTQLPPEMCARLDLDKSGGYVWFLPDSGSSAWKAWKEEDLDAVFGDRTGDPDE
jgi:hypothetical protein